MVVQFKKDQGLEKIPNQTVWSIAKDSDGFIWFGSNAGLFRYDGYNIKPINEFIPSVNMGAVRAIVSDNNGALWVGTKGKGLFRISGSQVDRYDSKLSKDNDDADFVTAILSTENDLWFATYNSLNKIDVNNTLTYHELPGSQKNDTNYRNMPSSNDNPIIVSDIINISDQQLLLTTYDSVYFFDKTTGQFTHQVITDLTDAFISSAYLDSQNNIWLATSLGVFYKPHNETDFKPYRRETINVEVNKIVVDEKNIWIGTVSQGLVKVSINSGEINQYKHDINNKDSISGDSITTLFLDDSGILFISSFFQGVSYLDTHTLNFGKEGFRANSVYCAGSSVFRGIDVDENGVVWLSTQSGLIEYDANNDVCINHNLDSENNLVYPNNSPKYSFKDSFNTRWIITSKGLNKLNSETGLIDTLAENNLDKFINTMIELQPGLFLIATRNGLYQYDTHTFNIIEWMNGKAENIEIYDISNQTDEGYYLATNNGLAIYDKQHKFSILEEVQSQLPDKDIAALFVADNQDLWLAIDHFGLYQFDKNKQLLAVYSDQQGFLNSFKVNSIIKSKESIWLGADTGLIQLNTTTDEITTFFTQDGLQGEMFFPNAISQAADGKIYLGARSGFYAFYADEIKINTTKPKIVLTQFTRFGKSVQANPENKDFKLNKPINELDALTLTHKDYIVGFEFAALDYADPNSNKYAYQMEGLDPDWNYVNADNRNVSYTNLKAGDYIFKVKGANKDGVWNESGKQLQIKVYPAPWLSWWAYTLYVLTFFLLLFGYLYRKNQANIKITLMLREEVDRQTKEIQEQKLTVENLLDKKNELFANVSHEFRTPLTLILGPINKLLDSKPTGDDLKSLQMVNRNANRLLTMIEQILQLAKLTDLENITFIPQQVHTQVDLIVESFQVLAETKNISLTLHNNDEVAINATQDCIDNILGNLLSNAIKYTPNGGSIAVNSKVKNNAFTLSVTDTGCGLDEQQQIDIFNRFARLEAHHDVAGVGIGLSLVAEIVKVNKGHIKVHSTPGEGSTFAVTFECINLNQATAKLNNNQLLIDQLIKESILGEQSQDNSDQFIGNKNHPNLLIIDDNKDMREHIADSLKQNYYCMLASRGKAGIALAIKHVPEIIICDVMMPEMDGFQVSRILRSDSRTSHIPLILLTALNDKQSRIKGWRENIDVYLTKPFDAQELLLQLENILVIRNILKKKAHAAIQSGKVSMNSGLSKLDQKFLDKFIGIIEDMYSNPNFLRPQMASMMTVSERQLQRKIKALIDRNPLDLLREYRLKKSAETLKDGYQVSITADMCGFNSVTYFSKCFKQQYGITPKEYQSTCSPNS